MIRNTIRLIKNIQSNLMESEKKYYHGDNTEYKIGDIISIKATDLEEVPKDIIDAYNKNLNLGYNIEKAVYLIDNLNKVDEYKEPYRFVYEVEHINLSKAFSSDYSYIMCEDFLSKHKDENRPILIEAFIKAYTGDNDTKNKLELAFNYDKSDTIEYLCKEAKVTTIM